MSDTIKTYPVPAHYKNKTLMTETEYAQLYQQSIERPEQFWAQQAETLVWFQPWDKIKQGDFGAGSAQWFVNGKLNVSHNCLDRHLETRGDQIAILWEGDQPNQTRQLSYRELHRDVCKFANALKAQQVKSGDRVCIYMPMIPEAAIAMLACTRIGAVHSVVFGGFSPEALNNRILDSDCQIVITADGGFRGGKHIPLKQNVDQALINCPNVRKVFVVQHSKQTIAWHESRDLWYHEACDTANEVCEPEVMDAESPLFILYTSGSTGKPKGVLHTTAGYLLQASLTHKYVLDCQPGDIYWCTADVGWITGHSYIVYGPLCNGVTTLMFEGVPTYPDASRCWEIIDKYQVNIFYTAPTAIRALMALGDEPVKKYNRDSLKLLGTVGEPINPEAWEWYYKVVGNSHCPIVDTWWQTETGAIMIAPLPGATALKPGSATQPFFGVEPILLDPEGNILEGEAQGNLAIKNTWPSQIRTVYGDHQRLLDTYFSQYPGYYFTGDGAQRDKDGYYWITGRVDDVINVSGHRLGTAEIESALVLHPQVAEAAVVGIDHDIKGQSIYAFVTPMKSAELPEDFEQVLKAHVQTHIGAIAKPEIIQITPALPKTRSGKIMRRILRKIAAGEFDQLGDTSTLAEPQVVDDLIKNKR